MSGLKKCGFLIVLLCSLFALSSYAQNPEGNGFSVRKEIPLEVPVGDKVDAFHRSRIINGFLNAAVSRVMLWADDTNFSPIYIAISPKGESVNARSNPEDLSFLYPWLVPLLYPDGPPRFGAVSKWKQPVRIAFNLPNDMKPYSPDWPNIRDKKTGVVRKMRGNVDAPYDIQRTFDAEKKQAIVEEISLMLPSVRKATGLDIAFAGDEDGPVDPPANMRIVLMDQQSWWGKTDFKTGRHHTTYFRFKGDIEWQIPGASLFTPNSEYQVDGYFVSNKNNEIIFSACYLSDKHNADMLLKLLRECVLRSMGFPQSNDISYNSYLSYWNDPRVTKEKYGKNLIVGKPGLNDTDELFLNILYSPEVETGVVYYELFKKLMGE